VYDDLDTFKVNDVVEFVGVLSVDPSLARFQEERYAAILELSHVTGQLKGKKTLFNINLLMI